MALRTLDGLEGRESGDGIFRQNSICATHTGWLGGGRSHVACKRKDITCRSAGKENHATRVPSPGPGLEGAEQEQDEHWIAPVAIAIP